MNIHVALIISAALMAFGSSAARAAEPYKPVKWERFVKVEGQTEPVPEQWLADEEARVAYSLVLPDAVPKPRPFDFTKAWWARWLPGTPSVAVQYFDHLCSTEAGEWIFKKVKNVEGFYYARPQGEPTTDVMTDPYGPEMPWIQRLFMLRADTLHDQGTGFIQPPLYNYRFIEQPHREVAWQQGIRDPFIRLHGYTREQTHEPSGRPSTHWKEKTPMQVTGTPTLSSRYGYTWRGIKRPRDREHGVAGGELIIYELHTKEVLAVRRQFLIASHNARGTGKAMWEVAARCSQLPSEPGSGEVTQLAFDVLETTEPSRTGRKKP